MGLIRLIHKGTMLLSESSKGGSKTLLLKKVWRKVRALLPKSGDANRPVGDMTSFLEDIKTRGFNPSVICDVGANRGFWSKDASRIFPNAHFLLVEPLQEMEPYLKKFCRSFSNATYALVGLGAEASELDLGIADDLGTATFYADDEVKTRSVPVKRLDTLIKELDLGVPSLVKVDVQGFEMAVVKGAGHLLEQIDMWILETPLFHALSEERATVHQVMAIMSEHGYVPYDFPGFLRRDYDGALGLVDICFVKKDLFLRTHHDWV